MRNKNIKGYVALASLVSMALLVLLSVHECAAQMERSVQVPREIIVLDQNSIAWGRQIHLFKKNELVTFVGYKGDFYKVDLNGKTGFVYYTYLKGASGLDGFKDYWLNNNDRIEKEEQAQMAEAENRKKIEADEQKRKAEEVEREQRRKAEEVEREQRRKAEEVRREQKRKADEVADEKRYQELVKRFGQSYGNRIYASMIWIGMSEDMAIESIGSPTRRNTTTNSAGTHEQWVYQDRYLYFENGKLTSWQESK